jgi:hypothetical protein
MDEAVDRPGALPSMRFVSPPSVISAATMRTPLCAVSG